jgi:hypothetical protein
MAKAIELSPKTMTTPRKPMAAGAAKPGPAKAAEPREPLQVRWPAADIQRAKLAALEAKQNMSDFTLACLHLMLDAHKGKGANNGFVV